MTNADAVPPPLTPPHKWEGDTGVAVTKKSPKAARWGATAKSSSPRGGGVRGGGSLA